MFNCSKRPKTLIESSSAEDMASLNVSHDRNSTLVGNICGLDLWTPTWNHDGNKVVHLAKGKNTHSWYHKMGCINSSHWIHPHQFPYRFYPIEVQWHWPTINTIAILALIVLDLLAQKNNHLLLQCWRQHFCNQEGCLWTKAAACSACYWRSPLQLTLDCNLREKLHILLTWKRIHVPGQCQH